MNNCYTFFVPPEIRLRRVKVIAVKKVGILYHPMVEVTHVRARELEGFLNSRGVSAWLCSAWDRDKARAQLNDTDLILTVGGDGTILRAAQVVVPGTTPITGINLGKLGFMTELNSDEALEKLPALLGKDVWIDERAMLQAEIVTSGQEPRLFHALNDVVVARGEIARAIRIEAIIDGQYLTTYKTDGVIVATATGSTGYALAAGGPILHPQSGDFVLVPIAPHLSSAYALVLPQTAELRLSVTAFHPATLSIDGHINIPISSGNTITIKHSPNKARFLRIRPENSFYSSLEERLKGKRSEPDRKG
jgi:NAD+ kinase